MKKKTISDEQKRLHRCRRHRRRRHRRHQRRRRRRHRCRRHRLELARPIGTSITFKFSGAAVAASLSRGLRFKSHQFLFFKFIFFSFFLLALIY